MKKDLGRLFLLFVFAYLVINSCFAFQRVAWGTGNWWGQYSFKWGAIFLGNTVFSTILIVVFWLALWLPDKLEFVFEKLIRVRTRMGHTRLPLAFLVLIAPIWFLQYTPWGIVFSDAYIRVLIWFVVVLILAFLVQGGSTLFTWNDLLAVVLVTSSAFVIVSSFMNV